MIKHFVTADASVDFVIETDSGICPVLLVDAYPGCLQAARMMVNQKKLSKAVRLTSGVFESRVSVECLPIYCAGLLCKLEENSQ